MTVSCSNCKYLRKRSFGLQCNRYPSPKSVDGAHWCGEHEPKATDPTGEAEQKRQRRALARELLQQRDQVQPQPKPKADRPPLKAKTPGQLRLIKAIKSASQVLVSGAAGTGKSYIASVIAADMLAANQIEKIVLTRPNVAAGKTLGHFPGSIDEKMAPWMIPLTELLSERLGSGHFKYCMDKGVIEIAPLETMRGRTFRNAFVIVDEAQNCSLHELKMLVTRVGEGTQLVITGDTNQTDLAEKSGLQHLIDLSKSHNIDCVHVELGLEDIVSLASFVSGSKRSTKKASNESHHHRTSWLQVLPPCPSTCEETLPQMELP